MAGLAPRRLRSASRSSTDPPSSPDTLGTSPAGSGARPDAKERAATTEMAQRRASCSDPTPRAARAVPSPGSRPTLSRLEGREHSTMAMTSSGVRPSSAASRGTRSNGGRRSPHSQRDTTAWLTAIARARSACDTPRAIRAEARGVGLRALIPESARGGPYCWLSPGAAARRTRPARRSGPAVHYLRRMPARQVSPGSQTTPESSDRAC